MKRRARKLCTRCEQLERQLAEQAELLKVLRAKVLQLEEKLAAAQKDSSTSSVAVRWIAFLTAVV